MDSKKDEPEKKISSVKSNPQETAEEENEPSVREYTIKLVPDTGEVRSIRLSARLLKFGLASFVVGALLFVGAFSYAVYGTFAHRSDAAEIEELRQVNSIQQEQLLQLSKKANSLQDQMEQLTQLEQQIRRSAGASPAADDPAAAQNDAQNDAQNGAGTVDASGTHNGQGGPYVAPDIRNVSQTLDEVEKRLETRRQSLLQLQQELKANQEEIGSLTTSDGMMLPGSTTPSLWPARGEVSSPFGLRWSGSDFHPGIDIANDMGTPIVATADGVVTTAGWNSGGYGNMVDIDHGNGIMTRYGHAMQVVVRAGQTVHRGQVIAYMGSTGYSTGPHVHYEVRINGSPVNPIRYL